MKRAALLILACAFTACSQSGNPSNPNPAQPGGAGTPGSSGQKSGGDSTNTGAINKPSTDLTEYAWCSPYHNQGRDFQFRLSLAETLTYETRVYTLVARGGRGAEVTEWQTHGSYQLSGATLTLLDSSGQTNSFAMRLDPADAVTGAKKLHLTNASVDSAFDPCL